MARSRNLLRMRATTTRCRGVTVAAFLCLPLIIAVVCVPAYGLVTPVVIESRTNTGVQGPSFTFNGPAPASAKSNAAPRPGWNGGALTGAGCYYAGQSTPSKYGDWSFTPAAGRGGYYNVYATWPVNTYTGGMLLPTWTVHNAGADVSIDLNQASGGNSWNQLAAGVVYDAGVAKTVHLNTNPDSVGNKRTYFDSVAFEPCIPTAVTPTFPADGAVNIPSIGVGNEFTWTPGNYNYRYDVYISTVQADVTSKAADALAATDLTEATFDPDGANLNGGITYYWMVVAKNVDQTIDGPVRSFTAGGFSVTANPASWTNANTVTLTFDASEQMTVDHYELQVDGGGYTTQTSPYALDVSLMSDGTHTVQVKAVSDIGEEVVKPITIRLDKTGPANFVPTASPSTYTRAASVQVTFGTTDATSGMAHYELALDGGAYTTRTSPYTLDVSGGSGIADGAHTMHVKAVDVAGNETICDVPILLDKIAPLAFTPTCNPASWTNTNSAQITFATTDATSGVDFYTVDVDAGSPTTTGSPYTIDSTSLADGVHTITVVAVDMATNTRACTTSLSIDRTPPILTSCTSPAAWGGAAIPVDYVTSDATSGVKKVSLWYKKGSGGDWTDSTLSSATASGTFSFAGTTGDDTYYFGLVVEDNAGNTTSSNSGSGSDSTSLDHTAPNFTAINASPAVAKAGTEVTITFTSSEALAANPTVTVNGSAAAFDSVSGLDYTYKYTIQEGDTEGYADIYVEGEDAASNSFFTDDVTHLLIDQSPPDDFTPTADPPSWTNAGSIEITYATTDSVSNIDSYQLAIDGGEYTPEASPYTLDTSGLSDGTHTVHVKAIDVAGNELIKDVTVYIDQTDPADFTPVADPSGWTSANNVSITFAATDAASGIAHYELALDDGAYADQTSPYTLDVSLASDGTHVVHVKAIDNAGNELTKDVNIRLDKTAPADFTPAANPASWTNAASVSISFATTDAASAIDHYEVALDGGGYSTRTSPYSLDVSGAANGTHTVHVKAVDSANNELVKDVTIYVDKGAPEDFTPTANPATWTNGASVSIQFSTTDAVSDIHHYELAVDGGAYSTQTSPYSLSTVGLSNASHVVHVKAIDLGGNSRTKDVTIYIDKTAPPDFTATADPASWTKAGSVEITFSATDGTSAIDHYEVALDDGAYTTQTSPYTLDVSGVADGTHVVHVKAIDSAGNSRTKNVNVYLDKTKPADFTPAASPAGWTGAASVAITFAATDATSGIARYAVALDDGPYTNRTSPYALDVSAVPDGVHSVHVRAVDNAGNLLEKDVTIYLDKTPPADFTPAANPSVWTRGSTVAISFATTDATAGIHRYEVSLDSGAYTTCTSPFTLDVSAVADGVHTVHVKAVDKAGNRLIKDVPIRLDKTRPAAFRPVSNIATWCNQPGASTYQITWNTTDATSGIDHYEVAFGTGAYTTATSPYTLNTLGVTPGTYTLHVKAFDKAGNFIIGNLTAQVTADVTPPTAALVFQDPIPSLGRQFDYVFWKNWMGVTAPSQNIYYIRWTSSDSQSGVGRIYIECRPNATSAWTVLKSSTAASGVISFNVSLRPESDSYQFRIRAIDTANNQKVVLYDKFGLYDARKLAPTAKVISPANNSWLLLGMTTTVRVQETMPVFNDPRNPGNAYRYDTPDWWFAGHTLTATPKLKAYRRSAAGRPTALDTVLLASVPRLAAQYAVNDNATQRAQCLGYVLVNTWETTYPLRSGIVKPMDVFQVEMKYSDILSVGWVRQPDKPNKPGQILPSITQEPLIDMLKQYEFARFWVR